MKKNGKDENGRQRFKCTNCNFRFRTKYSKISKVVKEYVKGKQTYKQLEKRYNL